MTMIKNPVISAILLIASITLPLLRGQSPSTGAGSPDQWQFTLAPYILFPWIDGTTAIKGREVPVNIAPKEIFSNLQFAVLGAFEARKGKWAVGADTVYVALGTTVDRPAANIDYNQGYYTFMGLRQLNQKVDFLFGARWNVIQGKLSFKGPLGITVEDTKQWVDPIVGLNFRQPLGHKLHFSMQADIGGFGAGSKFAWHLFPVVGMDVGKRTTLGIGYRVLSEDYSSGTQTALFKSDVILQALVIGAAFHF